MPFISVECIDSLTISTACAPIRKPSTSVVRVGTAGWSIPKRDADRFPGVGTHLERYARVFNCTEINTSFYRSHRFEVYEKWAKLTPKDFRFAVKLPKEISHGLRLRSAKAPWQKFVDEIAGLGDRMGALLVQLPPSLNFEARVAGTFFRMLTRMYGGSVACEPRHASWFGEAATALFLRMGISRAAADPARIDLASEPGGWLGRDDKLREAVRYYRWHGSPRIYYSSYDDLWLRARVSEIDDETHPANAWCIFDNTASGSSNANAISFMHALKGSSNLLTTAFEPTAG